MSWFRSHARLGSCVALLALTLQLVLSFGHIHSGDILGQSASAPTAEASIIASLSDEEAAPSPDRAGHDHEHEYCAIYAIAALIAAAQQAEPPAVPVPLVQTSASLPSRIESPPYEPRHRLSRARGPPLA
jgi:hypothetical protein